MLQRKCACGGQVGRDGECEACRKRRLQRSAIRQSSGLVVPPEVDHVLRSPGRGLGAETGTLMQQRLGHDFSHVRIHDDAMAAESAAAVSAHAYTVGHHVVFGAGEFRDGSPTTQRLLAHELTHVQQQQGASSSGADSHRLEAEAERAESPFSHGVAMPSVTAAGQSLARDDDTAAVDEAATQADAAEAACDIRSLCRLHFRAPERVTSARVSRVFSACHPIADASPGWCWRGRSKGGSADSGSRRRGRLRFFGRFGASLDDDPLQPRAGGLHGRSARFAGDPHAGAVPGRPAGGL